MSQTLYGAQLFKSPNREANYDGGIVIGANSEEFTNGDPVTISGGYLAVAGTTDKIYGVVQKTQTMASDNQTVAKVKPVVQVPDQDYEFLMGTNSDLAATDIGTYYKLTTATSGAVQVDVASGAQTGANRIVVLTKVDPNALGGSGSGSGLRQGLFKFVTQFNIKTDN